MYKDFESFLVNHFLKYEDTSLDSYEWRDNYEYWLEQLDSNDFIRLADEYAKTIRRA